MLHNSHDYFYAKDFVCISSCYSMNHSKCLFMQTLQVLLIGGSTGTMLESLQVVGDSNRYRHPYEASTYTAYHKYMQKTLYFSLFAIRLVKQRNLIYLLDILSLNIK